MKRTSKVIIGVAVVLLLVIAGGIWFLYANLDSLVAGIIEREGSRATETDVSVDAVSIDLQAGTAGISRLAVANPEGFSDEPAIALEGFAIDLDPMAVTDDPLIIERIAVDGASLLVEQQGAKNNLRTILSAVQQQASEPAPESQGRKLIIERFELTNASATLRAPGLTEERQVAVPAVVLTDVGRATNGATAAAIAEQLLRPIIEMALEAAAARGAGGLIREKLEETEADVANDLLERLGHPSDDDDEPR